MSASVHRLGVSDYMARHLVGLDRFAWKKENFCERADCARRYGPHFYWEYGCVSSEVWACPPQADAQSLCPNTRVSHVLGCGCPGDPLEDLWPMFPMGTS